MTEYYRLLGLDCSAKLRQKLDCAIHLADRPVPEKFAYFNRCFDGGCPLHDEDGLCMVQRECGEAVLSSVCRYFPRSPKSNPFECSCANSCENTIELLIANDRPLSFVKVPLDFVLESEPVPRKTEEDVYTSIRNEYFARLCDRSIPLSSRLIGIGGLCGGTVCTSDPQLSYSIRRKLTEKFMAASDSLYDFGNSALASASDFALYENNYARFCENYPKHEIWIEKILANHMFYDGFPFSDDTRVKPYDEYIALVGVYLLLSFLCAGCLCDKTDVNSFVDLCATVFRLIDNSNFDIRAAALLHENGIPKTIDASALLV